jgi:hypothetical protein
MPALKEPSRTAIHRAPARPWRNHAGAHRPRPPLRRAVRARDRARRGERSLDLAHAQQGVPRPASGSRRSDRRSIPSGWSARR